MQRIHHRVLVTPQTPYDQLPEYLTMHQVAAYTQQSYWSVQQAVCQGKIPHTTKFSRKLKHIPKTFFNPQSELAVQP